MFGSQVFLVVETGGQHLLGVGHDVGPVLQLEVFVAPHLPRGPAPSLDLVYDQLDVVFPTESLEASEPVTRPVVVSTLGLDRLSYDPLLMIIDNNDDNDDNNDNYVDNNDT